MFHNNTIKVATKKIFFKENKQSSGFTLVEILIACTIILVSSIALMSAATKGVELSNRALKQSQANLVIEEGVEAVRTIRDANWTTISGLTLDTNYYLTFDNNLNVWSLGTTPTPLIDSTFTRVVVFSAVNRDVNDDISLTGTLDTNTKKVKVAVSWNMKGQTTTRDLTFYIADIFN